jgi:hypothetical protein
MWNDSDNANIPVIAIPIFVLVDDRWGLALPWDILMATMCKDKYIAGSYFGYINCCYQRWLSASTLLPSGPTIIINISMSDVDIINIAINVINRAHNKYGRSTKYYNLLKLAGTYHIQSIPYKVTNPQFPHPTLPNANVLRHFALGFWQFSHWFMPWLAWRKKVVCGV